MEWGSWEARPQRQDHPAGNRVRGLWELCRGAWPEFCIGALLKGTDELQPRKLPLATDVAAALNGPVLMLSLGQELRSSEWDRACPCGVLSPE